MILIVVLFILFLVWTYLVKYKNVSKLDNVIYNNIKIIKAKTLFFMIVTNFANTKFLIFVCLALFVLKSKFSIIISLLMCFDVFLVFLIKHLVKRERPNILRLVREKGYSYPSGHTFSAVCFYGFLIYLLSLSGIFILFKIFLMLFLIVLIFLIGYSRIYLGVHYFSDVIGAFLISVPYIMFYVYILSNV